MSATPVQIFDQISKRLVEAELHDGIPADRLVEVELDWGMERLTAYQRRRAEGVPAELLPQHWHWNWARKIANLDLLLYRFLGIECAGRMQGLMMLEVGGRAGRLDSAAGKPLSYIHYIEVAPWNLRAFTDAPRFGAIGIRLIQAAVRLSRDEEMRGRIGLHALPQAEAFYRDTCGMTSLGCDPDYENLPYFEMTWEQADQFIAKGADR